jgi:hypothetical protein
MQPLGKKKRPGTKHPHDECEICSESKILKNRDKNLAKKEIEDELKKDMS